ncbi:MAG: hypothetical protein RL477_1980 [Pseudomonadota bacterium]
MDRAPAVLSSPLDSESFFAKRRIKGRLVSLANAVPDSIEPALLSAADPFVASGNESGSEDNLRIEPRAHAYQALAPPAI